MTVGLHRRCRCLPPLARVVPARPCRPMPVASRLYMNSSYSHMAAGVASGIGEHVLAMHPIIPHMPLLSSATTACTAHGGGRGGWHRRARGDVSSRHYQDPHAGTGAPRAAGKQQGGCAYWGSVAWGGSWPVVGSWMLAAAGRPACCVSGLMRSLSACA